MKPWSKYLTGITNRNDSSRPNHLSAGPDSLIPQTRCHFLVILLLKIWIFFCHFHNSSIVTEKKKKLNYVEIEQCWFPSAKLILEKVFKPQGLETVFGLNWTVVWEVFIFQDMCSCDLAFSKQRTSQHAVVLYQLPVLKVSVATFFLSPTDIFSG